MQSRHKEAVWSKIQLSLLNHSVSSSSCRPLIPAKSLKLPARQTNLRVHPWEASSSQPQPLGCPHCESRPCGFKCPVETVKTRIKQLRIKSLSIFTWSISLLLLGAAWDGQACPKETHFECKQMQQVHSQTSSCINCKIYIHIQKNVISRRGAIGRPKSSTQELNTRW